MAKKRIKTVTDGFFQKNPVLISGLITAPAVVCTDTLENALLLAAAFSLITFCSVLLSLLVPRSWVYGIRLIVYTLIAAIVYVPVFGFCNYLFADTNADIGIFFPLLTVNSLIAAQSETLFDRRNLKLLLPSVLFYIFGFDAAILLIALIREFFAHGTIHGNSTELSRTIPFLASPAGGFLVVGLLAVGARKLRIIVRARQQKGGER
ncbi:MAG: hypothetical protein E7501_07495 [Ruminococcus sp.]|nr:hypothetical protein [Ruminococcus sp.]MBQ8906690.1 hypothetical protein [Ruminococcus sp.]